MRYSLSFLGCSTEQLRSLDTCNNTATEAVLFNENHLDREPWSETWDNIVLAAEIYDPQNVTFHFPMNECDYVANQKIKDKLKESYLRAAQIGLAGIVVHSNRIRDVAEWVKFDHDSERKKIFEILLDIKNADASSATWIGLENMPLVGNFGYETDPLFVGAEDFADIPVGLNIVWDTCHALSSLAYVRALRKSKLPRSIFAREISATQLTPSNIIDRIKHWHFAAFTGLNNPETDSTCKEGVLPNESDLSTDYYENAMFSIISTTPNNIINFEVQEDDYGQRIKGRKIIEWANGINPQLQD